MKRLLILTFVICTLGMTSQEKKEIIPDRVFATLDDLLNGTPVPGFRVVQVLSDGPVLKNDDDKKVKTKALGLKDYYLTESYPQLQIWKCVDGDFYQIHYLGKLSHFSKKGQEYYSETPTGEMIKLSRDKFDEFLEQYGLKKQWHADKEFSIGASDGVNEAASKRILKKAKYFRLMSEKIK